MKKRNLIVAVAIFALVAASLGVTAYAQMNKPETVTVSGVMADYSCASKGKVMMDSWYNATHDEHKTPDGPKPNCATMCLKNLGQPAALFDTDKQRVAAVFACNPAHTLGEFAAQEVEVQGFWAGGKHNPAFVPQKIRGAGAGEWQEVTCAVMH